MVFFEAIREILVLYERLAEAIQIVFLKTIGVFIMLIINHRVRMPI